jgi:Tfp pilus assembly protein PilZ
MLQMKCPACETTISSPFLAEVGSTTCNHCKENVSVNDVFVTTTAFTMHRDTLLKRVRHYRTLLNEVEREKMLPRDSDVSSTAAQKNLEKNYAALRELLEASRENYRLTISQDLPLSIKWEGNTRNGCLLNLSTKGAAIKPQKLHGCPQKGSEVKLQLALPDNTEPLSITAKVAWTGKHEKAEGQNDTTMGVSFINVNEKARIDIWDYIVDAVKSSQYPEKSKPSLAIS